MLPDNWHQSSKPSRRYSLKALFSYFFLEFALSEMDILYRIGGYSYCAAGSMTVLQLLMQFLSLSRRQESRKHVFVVYEMNAK